MFRTRTVLLALVVAAAGCGDDDERPLPDGPASFKVMTQNMYLGGELDFLVGVEDLRLGVDRIWQSVQATDFEARAALLADSIEAADPDVIGLQEATIWRTQSPGDGLRNATTVAHDFLSTLMSELSSRGLTYRIVETVTNGDVELQGSDGTDYRLTDQDAIVAKSSLPIVSSSSGTFARLATIEITTPFGPVQAPIPRGWVSARFRSGGRTISLFNAHLEPISQAVATEQARELLAIADPTARPTVILGDMNLHPGDEGYSVFVAEETGLTDAWTLLNPADDGFTCCWSPDLREGDLSVRIDVVFSSGGLVPTSAGKVNEAERTSSGLAPSDHAGVVVSFE